MKGKREARMSHEMALGGHLVVSIRSSRPYARGHQTWVLTRGHRSDALNFGWLSRRTARSSPLFLEFILDDLSHFGALRSSTR